MKSHRLTRLISGLCAALFTLSAVYAANPPQAGQAISTENAAGLRLAGAVGYGYANDAAFAPDGDLVAMATGNGVWLFDSAFTPVRQLHTGAANAVAWRFDGTEVAAGLVDGTVRVWDAQTGDERIRIDAHEPGIPSAERKAGAVVVGWSPDGTQIFSVGDDGDVTVWESRNGAVFFDLSGHDAPVLSAALSTFGVLASATADELFLWNTMTGLADPIDGYHSLVAWSSDARFIATQDADGALVILDANTRSPVQTFETVDFGGGGAVRWSSRATIFAYGATLDSAPATVAVFDAWTGGQRGSFGAGMAARVVAWSPDGGRLAVWDAQGAMMVISVDMESIQQRRDGWPTDGQALAWSPDGGQVAIVGAESALVWDVLNGAAVDSTPAWLPAPDSADADSESIPIAAIITTEGGDNTLTLYDTDGTIRGEFPTPFSQIEGAAIVETPAGDVLAGSVRFTDNIGVERYAVVLWSAATGAQLAQTGGVHGQPVMQLAFSPDGGTLATMDADGVTYLWRVG